MSALMALDGIVDVLKHSPLVETPTDHMLVDEMYARRIVIPPNTVIMGRVHKKPGYFILMQGTISVTTQEGIKTINAPYVEIALPGRRRIGITHDQCICMTIHRTQQTDLIAIEADLTEVDERNTHGVGNLPKELK